MKTRPVDRRDFLKTAGLGLGAAALSGGAAPGAWAARLAPGRKTKHVVLVAFAGGVRSKETIEMPENAPNLARIGAAGVVCPNVAAQNVGHYGAALSIFTGATEVFGIRENARSESPTVFEYLRKSLGLSANSVWLSTTGGNQQVNYSHGTHPKFGARYGANLISPDGVFNAEFKEIVEQFGTPRTPSDAEAAASTRLRGMLDGGALGGERLENDAEHQRGIEKFILDEISGQTTNLTGPGAADAKAVRIATNILRVFRPTLLGVALNQHDIAHGSYNGYTEIIRRNDQEIGALFDAVRADPELRDSTTILILPEFGRDRDLNERNGLDHGDGSEELGKVAMVGWGPDFRSGKVVKDGFKTLDVCPTVCSLFGVRPELAKGRVMRGILA
ncbi:MAG: twin-arginine translocation signal domain-containing protein [Planctomycetota bacterium JB042]